MGQLYPTKTLTVAQNGTTSDGVQIENYDVLGLDVPTLDSTTLKIQVSMDNITYRDVYDGGGLQTLNWSASTGARAFASRDLADMCGYPYIRIVLGSSQTTAARTFTLYVKAPRRI